VGLVVATSRPMRRFAILAAAILSAAPAFAQDLGGQDLTTKAAAVRDKALADPTAWRVVESLTTEVGPRPVGSPAMARARDWAVATLMALGFENVHVEPFTTRVWTRGEEAAEIVGPAPQKLQIIGLGNSAPTPTGGLAAAIAVFPTFQAMLDQPPGALKGKIAVVTQKMPRTQDGSSNGAIGVQRFQGPLEAARRGAVGYLVRSLSTDKTRLPHAGASTPAGIPAAALSGPDAEQLERLAARGGPVTVRLVLSSSVQPAAPAWTVVGEIKGSARPNEVVLLGGHLDSWDPGTGAIDDGAGVAIATGAAHVAIAAGRPRRTIRVVMWGSEEQTGSGAAYAVAHKAEIPGIVVAGESDLGAGRIWRVSLPARGAATPAMAAFKAAAAPLGVIFADAPPKYPGADLEETTAAGAPFVQFSQDASHYFDWHHSADDTLDKIKPDELAQDVAVWASFLYVVANSDVDFRKP